LSIGNGEEQQECKVEARETIDDETEEPLASNDNNNNNNNFNDNQELWKRSERN